jgi:hypothetical protein
VLAGFVLAGGLAQAVILETPRRPLSDSEWLAYTTSRSDAILLARVARLTESAMDGTDYTVDPEGSIVRIPYVDVTLVPVEWLKAKGTEKDLHVAAFPQGDGVLVDLQHLARDTRARAGVFFLERRSNRWTIANDPSRLGGSLLVPSDPTLRSRRLIELRESIRRQTLDSLLTRADLVVLARPSAGWRDSSVRIDRVLVGAPPGDSVDVTSAVDGMLEPRPSLLFL